MHASLQARPHPQAHKHWHAGQRADQRGDWQTALREYQRATQLAPRDALYWLSLATTQLQLGSPQQAQAAAERALDLEPGNEIALPLLARALSEQNQHSQAADMLERLPASVPRTAELMMAQAEALLRAERWQEAVAKYMLVLQKDVRNSLAYQHLALCFQAINRPRDAAVCLETAALTDKTGNVRLLALSQLVQMLRQAAEWPDLAKHTAALLQALDQSNEDVAAQIVPFTLLAIPTTAQQQLRVAALQNASVVRRIQPLPAPAARAPGRIRVGYLSADFCNHATMHLMAELLELHDRERFEIFLYCHSPQDGSPWQARARAAADHFRDVRHLPDADVARLMREDGVDIAIDLKGHTKDTRFQLLAYRPAPVQVGYLGYPGTSGAGFLDYVIGDPVVTPMSHAAHYSEHIAQMPHSYQPNDSHRVLPARPSRAEQGLPEDAIVLCSFNQIYKISPDVADVWARILRDAPRAVLWQVVWNEQAAANLVRELGARGVTPERLYFSPHASAHENLARLQCADLMLDTWPCNAHTTASDALWAGVPVLTTPGETYASRVAASLVTACGLPGMVCADPEAYAERAIALATDTAALRAAQQHLAQHRRTLPLFDSTRYTRDFEALLQRMFDRAQQGLAPDHLPAAA